MEYSRRSFLMMAGALAAPLPGALHAQAPGYSDKDLTDAWIKKWMDSLKSVNKPLHLGRFADRTYFLREPISWEPNKGQEPLKSVLVPPGFVTDFASIPRVFWSILPTDGDYTYPAIIHDYLYWEQPVSRSDADTILKHAMEDFKVSGPKIAAIYSGVRTGGSFAWDGNAALKKAGEKRTLKEWPTDPTVRWADWKKKAGVFV